MRPALLHVSVLAALVGFCPSQTDPPALRKKGEAAAKRTTELQARSDEHVAATRKSVGDPENKVQGDLDEIAQKVGGQDFAAGLGVIPIAEGHVEYVPEAARPAYLAALTVLRKTLEEGAEARAQTDCLTLLAERLESLQSLAKDSSDLAAPLRNLDESLNLAKSSRALTKAELAELRAQLAAPRIKARKRHLDEIHESTKTALAELETEFPSLQKAFQQRSERESAFARFNQAATSILDGLMLLPEEDSATTEMRKRLAKLEGPTQEALSKMSALAVGERLKGVLDFTAYMYEGWQQETGTVSAEDYLQTACTIDLLGYKKSATLANSALAWLALVAVDPEYQKLTPDPKFLALHAGVRKDVETALARLVTASEALVADIEKVGIADQAARDRAVYLADRDLRMALQEHPKQWELIAKVRQLTDAFDKKALGEAPALAKLREEATGTIDSHWSRMLAIVPITGGFSGDQAGKFRGKFVNFRAGHDHSDEYVPGEFDLVFWSEGELLAARYDPAVKAAVAAARTRLQLPPNAEDDYEIVAQVGPEGSLGLPAADGTTVVATLPCRQLRVIAVRMGPIGFLHRAGT